MLYIAVGGVGLLCPRGVKCTEVKVDDGVPVRSLFDSLAIRLRDIVHPPKQTEMESKISQFVAVTGASEEDALVLLEACAGDLDMAVSIHMESKGGGVTETDAAAGKNYEAL